MSIHVSLAIEFLFQSFCSNVSHTMNRMLLGMHSMNSVVQMQQKYLWWLQGAIQKLILPAERNQYQPKYGDGVSPRRCSYDFLARANPERSLRSCHRFPV